MYYIKAKGVFQFYQDKKVEDIFLGWDTGSYGSGFLIWTEFDQYAETFQSIEEAKSFWENKKDKIAMGYKVLDNSVKIVKYEWVTKKNLN